MTSIIKSILLSALSLSSSLVNAQSPGHATEQKIDSLFAEYTSESPGVAVVVVRGGQIIFQKGYGMANLEYKVPVTPQTVFNIASVSKQFTAFAIYLLEKQGKISFEDDIRKYIPELPQYEKPIRIRHLLAHTSGMRDQAAILALAGWQMDDLVTTEQILKIMSKQEALNFKTGTAFGYSNTGYTLLAEAIKRITGLSFSDFTQATIFKPLGMTNSIFYEDFHEVLNKHRAYSYEKINGEFVKRELLAANVGPSNLMTTVEDMAKWVNNFYHPIVGDAELIRNFNKISSLDNNKPVIWAARPGDTIFHAKGQLQYKHNGLKVMSHGGHDAAFRAVMTRFPENNLAIITLSNNEHYQMTGKVWPIAELYLKDQFIEQKLPVSNTINQSNDPHKPEVYNSRLKDFEGNYRSEELTTEYNIQIRNGKLIMTHQRLSDIELTSTGKDKFSGKNTFDFEMKFLRTVQKVTGFEISNFGAKEIKFVKKK